MSCLTRAASIKRLAGDGEDIESGVRSGRLPAVRLVVAALPDLLLAPVAAGHPGLAAGPVREC